jgi:hypothetical protein
MLQLKNKSPFAPSISLLPDADGVDTLFVLVRGSFELGPQLRIADKQLPPVLADEYWGDPCASSLKYASELHLGKLSTDVVVVGHAWVPPGRRVPEQLVSVQVAERAKHLRVFGDRVWKDSGFTRPEPFERMPLVYERAYGGAYAEAGSGVTHAEERNPVGVGFAGKRRASELVGQPVPNLEDPARPLQKPGDVSVPAGLGFVAASWLPRRAYAGTYDATWQQKRAPYLPLDFDPRFFNSASPELSFDRYLSGGETVTLQGVSPHGPLRFALPRAALQVQVKLAGKVETPAVNLETVLLEPDDNRCSLSWRAHIRCDKQALKIEEIIVEAAGAGA